MQEHKNIIAGLMLAGVLRLSPSYLNRCIYLVKTVFWLMTLTYTQKTIEGYLDSISSPTLNTIKTKVYIVAVPSSRIGV